MLIKHYPKNIFPENIISGITLRNKEIYPPIGFLISSGDLLTEEEVEKNRCILADDLGFQRSNLIFQKQVHGDTINRATSSYPIYESDGIISNEKGTVLVLSLADCCGILVYDESSQSVGAFHSGWKGTQQKIVYKGIKKMVEEFGTNPKKIKCWITPCAGAEDYEVGIDVAKYFPDFTKSSGNGKFLFDLKSAVKAQLIGSGVLEDNIEISSESTISDGRFHSFRRDKEKSGRMAAFIGILY